MNKSTIKIRESFKILKPALGVLAINLYCLTTISLAGPNTDVTFNTDIKPPQIFHQEQHDIKADSTGNLVFYVSANDNKKLIGVYMHHLSIDGAPFKKIVMTPDNTVSSDRFKASIAIRQIKRPVFEYYFEAIDQAGNRIIKWRNSPLKYKIYKDTQETRPSLIIYEEWQDINTPTI
ncbi:MAG: hypothetical protein OEY38_00485 [Gammaproteobacteria bacterium]|nr:hypothetical protein [Gammaproteobacteria bacterium]